MKVFIICNENTDTKAIEEQIRVKGDTPANAYWFFEKFREFSVADFVAMAYELIRICDVVYYADEKLDFVGALMRGKAQGDHKDIYEL